MAKKYTILIIDDQGRPIRESRFSRSVLWVFASISSLLLLTLGIGIYQYQKLHHAIIGENQLQTQLIHQTEKINNQKQQIRLFVNNINELKSSLLSLNDFEQKIRIMANLEHNAGQADLFAIGG